jgi:hypothetical protein
MNDNEGSWVIGFLLGFFLGCIGLIIGLVAGGTKTKQGAIGGFVGAIFLGMCLGGLSMVLQIVLS